MGPRWKSRPPRRGSRTRCGTPGSTPTPTFDHPRLAGHEAAQGVFRPRSGWLERPPAFRVGPFLGALIFAPPFGRGLVSAAVQLRLVRARHVHARGSVDEVGVLPALGGRVASPPRDARGAARWSSSSPGCDAAHENWEFTMLNVGIGGLQRDSAAPAAHAGYLGLSVSPGARAAGGGVWRIVGNLGRMGLTGYIGESLLPRRRCTGGDSDRSARCGLSAGLGLVVAIWLCWWSSPTCGSECSAWARWNGSGGRRRT